MNDEIVRLLVRQIEQVWSGVLCGGPPFLHARFEFMKSEAQPGDLVLVTSAPRNTELFRLGWLVCTGQQAFSGDWGDEEAPTEKFWEIETLGEGARFRWTNVSLLRVFNEDGLDHALTPVRRP